MFRRRRTAFIKDYASIMNQVIEDPAWTQPRRYKKRWKVERLFAWLHWFRRLVTRYEYPIEELPLHGPPRLPQITATFMSWVLRNSKIFLHLRLILPYLTKAGTTQRDGV